MKIDLNADFTKTSIYSPITKLELVEVGEFPNQRRLIIPDPGMTIIDMDLDRADAQFVAWEANDDSLKEILKAGADLHLENAKSIWGPQCTKGGPERKLAKRFCHAVNYGAYPKKLAASLGLTVKTAEWIYGRWFQIHPGIREWHNRVKAQLYAERLVRNPFGYERYYFDRPENVINEALAWCPQSAVGIIINTAWAQIDPVNPTTENPGVPGVEVLMQVHDSLTMQCPSRLTRELLPKIQEKSLVMVPYDDPLIIPVGFKISNTSWGDAEDPCENNKDPELEMWLAQGLKNAKEKASCQLAR